MDRGLVSQEEIAEWRFGGYTRVSELNSKDPTVGILCFLGCTRVSELYKFQGSHCRHSMFPFGFAAALYKFSCKENFRMENKSELL